MSSSFSFNKANAIHTGKVFLWTVSSALIVWISSIIAGVQVPPQYMFLIPIANTLLVALNQFINEQKDM